MVASLYLDEEYLVVNIIPGENIISKDLKQGAPRDGNSSGPKIRS